MPVNFTLTPIGSETPAKFSDIDDAMRIALGQPPDPKRYYLGWYDNIGFMLALGKTWGEIEAHARDYYDAPEALQERLDVITWLRTNYTAGSWRSR